MIKYFYLLLCFCYINSCTDLFSTREDKVEKPEGEGLGIFEEATTPETVLINYRRAIENNNTVEYMKVFSDPLQFPSQPYYFYGDANFNAQLDNPPWDYNEENIFATNLLADNSITSVTFNYVDSLPDIRYTSTGQDSLETVETDFFSYEISIKERDSSIEKIYKGQSQAKLFQSQKGSELWYIYEWTDESVDNNPSLSSLKIRLYQGQDDG
jgi:hypothetical protein